MPNMEEIRRIVRNSEFHVKHFPGTLNQPLFVIVLGRSASRYMDEIRERLHSRWNNTDDYLSTAFVSFDAALERPQFDMKSGRHVLAKGRSAAFVSAQLTGLALALVRGQLQRQHGMPGADICVITSSGAEEAVWAGPMAMLLRQALFNLGVHTGIDAKLFCLLEYMPPYVGEEGSLKKLMTGPWQNPAKLETKYYIETRAGQGTIGPLAVNKTYGALEPIFSRTCLIGILNSLAKPIETRERLDMLMTMLDPCSRIDWQPEGKTDGRFFSCYAFPSQLEPGADLALTWKICHERFSAEYGSGSSAAVPEAAEFNRKHRPRMQQAYEQALAQVAKGMERQAVHFAPPANEAIALKNKRAYLWFQAGLAMEDKVAEWKQAYIGALSEVWNAQWLADNTEKLLVKCDIKGISVDDQEQIDAHKEKLDRWARDQIIRRRLFLQEMQGHILDRISAEIDGVLRQFQGVLDNVGRDGAKIMEARKAQLKVLDGMPEIYRIYVERLSTAEGSYKQSNFLEDAEKKLFDPATMLQPYPLPEPSSDCYAVSPQGAMPQVKGDPQPVSGGYDKDMYYIVCTVDCDYISELGQDEEDENDA